MSPQTIVKHVRDEAALPEDLLQMACQRLGALLRLKTVSVADCHSGVGFAYTTSPSFMR